MLIAKLFIAALSILAVVLVRVVVSRWLPKTGQARNQPIDWHHHRPVGIEDFHAWASEIRLHDGAPDDVRSHFATALNLLVYAWFYYPFGVTAQFLAYVSVEFALRFRYRVGQYFPFKKLVARAVPEGLVQDKGFSHIGGRDFHDSEIRHLPSELRAYAFDEPTANSYFINQLFEPPRPET